MAIYTSAASGLWSAGTTWVGGIKPPSGAGNSIIIAVGHVVEYDEANGEYGDDTATAVTINGTFKWSRTLSTTFTCRGHFTVANGGVWDRGTSIDPIPLGVVATFKANYSLTPADGKWGITFNPSAQIWNYGYARNTNTRLVNDIAIGATTCRVEDGTNWQVGDTIVFAPTRSSISEQDVKTILTVTPVSGTIVDVTWTGGVTYPHAAKGAVGNFTSNIVNTVQNTLYRSYWYETLDLTTLANTRENRYMLFYEYNTNNVTTFERNAAYCIYSLNATVTLNPYKSIGNILFHQTTNGSGFVNGNYKGRFPINDFAFYLSNNGISIRAYQGAVSDYNRCVVYKSSQGTALAYSEGNRNSGYYDCVFTGCGLVIGASGGPLTTMTRCIAYSCTYIADFTIASPHFYYDCQWGAGPDIPVGAGIALTYLVNGGPAAVGEVTVQDTMFLASKTMVYDNAAGFQRVLPSFKLTIVNKNKDVTLQEIYKANAAFLRDNTTKSRGTSSIQMETRTSIATSFEPIYIPGTDGVPMTIKGRMRKNASYGSATRPQVTLSGLGITPVTIVMPDTIDTWEEFTFNVTPTGLSGNLTLVFTGQSASTLGRCWLDGILYSPFVTAVDHYGYLYNPSSNVREVDPAIQLTEAQVAALTGISYAAGTLTVTSPKTIHDLYDWMRWYCVENHIAPLMTSSDDVNFTLNANLTLTNTSLTGVGTKLLMPAYTLTNTNSIVTIDSVTHNAGTLTSISVTGLITGSRVQVYNVSDGVELYNDVVVGTSLSLPATWTVNKTIRVRAVYVSGVTAKLPVEMIGSLTVNGMSVSVVQLDDLIYNANGIDGTTTTEFTPNYNAILVEVNDLDGTTTVQRLYAWYCTVLMTPAGIAATQGGILAEDLINYKIITSILNVKIKNMSLTPTILLGARLYRDDSASIFDVSVGPIQLESGKAYQAPGVVTLSQIEASSVLAKELTATAIKNKTDTIPLDPATNSGVWEVAVPVSPTVGTWSALMKSVLTVSKFIGLK